MMIFRAFLAYNDIFQHHYFPNQNIFDQKAITKQSSNFTQGDFIIQEENAEAIEEALRVLREWNPEWKPAFFMTDYSNAEISAIESCRF